MHLCINLNAEHGETEGDESPEAEENVSFLFVCNDLTFSKLAVWFDFSQNLLIAFINL